jgi:hypothetical protein
MKLLESTRQGFDKIPTPAKIIVYSGIALIVATLVQDIEAIEGIWVKYLSIVLGIITNLLTWLLLSLKDEVK